MQSRYRPVANLQGVVGEFEKAFGVLNTELFDGALPAPMFTVTPTTRSYTKFVPFPVWSVNGGGKAEINIAAGVLNWDLKDIMASLLHECIHLYCFAVIKEKDTSNKNLYHNKVFKREAEAHGLNVKKDEVYGYKITTPGDKLLNLILNHNELSNIEAYKYNADIEPMLACGNMSATRSFNPLNSNAHQRKYICPRCMSSVRATKCVRIACLDCGQQMVLAGNITTVPFDCATIETQYQSLLDKVDFESMPEDMSFSEFMSMIQYNTSGSEVC